MGQILACPFCRELYSAEEATRCSTCEVELVPLGSLPLSEEVRLEEGASEPHPDDKRFGLFHLGHGRGLLVLAALLGLAFFFAPWVVVQEPDLVRISGYDIARSRMSWYWGGALGFFILLPLIITRRCRYELRGVRIISATFSVMTLLEGVVLLVRPPATSSFIRVTYDWGWGLYASLLVSFLATVVSLRLGGPAPVLPQAKESAPKATIDRNKNPQLH